MHGNNERLSGSRPSLTLALAGVLICLITGCSNKLTDSTKTGVIGQGKVNYHYSLIQENPLTGWKAVQTAESIGNWNFQIIRDDQGFNTVTGSGAVAWSLRTFGECNWEDAASGTVAISGVFIDSHRVPTSVYSEFGEYHYEDYGTCFIILVVQINWKQPVRIRENCPFGKLGELESFGVERRVFSFPLKKGSPARDDLGAIYTLTEISIDSSTGCSVQ